MATLIAAGDIALGDSVPSASFGTRSNLEKYPKLRIFENVKESLRSADVVFGNLETVLSDHGLIRNSLSSVQLRGSEHFISQIVDAGFNVLNVANNHILQHGERPFRKTLCLLRKHGIATVGESEKNGRNCKPACIEIHGKQIVFLGYCYVSEKYYSGTTLYSLGDEETILYDVIKYKKPENLLVVSLHWGKEFIDYPATWQIRLARKLIDSGCDLILGHHPHVVQGYEKYKGKLIFYSLGNFVFDMRWNKDCERGIMPFLKFDDTFILKEIKPVIIGKNSKPSIKENREFAKDDLEKLIGKIAENSNEDEDAYLKKYLRLEKKNRYSSWLYMLKNLKRYDIKILKQLISSTIEQKMQNIKKQCIHAGNYK